MAPNSLVNSPGGRAAAGGSTAGGGGGATASITGGTSGGGTLGVGADADGTAGGATFGAGAGGGGAVGGGGWRSASTLNPSTSDQSPLRTSGSARCSSHSGKLVSPCRNSVTIAKPDDTVAASRMRALSADERRPSIVRSAATASGPAASARCTMTTRPVTVSSALCVRMPSATATHLRSWYRDSKFGVVIRKKLGDRAADVWRG